MWQIWHMHGKEELPCRIILILLAFSAILFLLPFFRPDPINAPLPTYDYAQGYFTNLPEIGIARVIPFSQAKLQSPASTHANMRQGTPVQKPAPY